MNSPYLDFASRHASVARALIFRRLRYATQNHLSQLLLVSVELVGIPPPPNLSVGLMVRLIDIQKTQETSLDELFEKSVGGTGILKTVREPAACRSLSSGTVRTTCALPPQLTTGEPSFFRVRSRGHFAPVHALLRLCEERCDSHVLTYAAAGVFGVGFASRQGAANLGECSR